LGGVSAEPWLSIEPSQQLDEVSRPVGRACEPASDRPTVELSGNRSPHNSTPKYLNIVRSNAVLYIDRLTIFIFEIPDPLSELEQKTDSPCLPNLEQLILAIADPLSGLTNVADSSCLPICDRTQTISTNSMGVSITYK
jgi:hypothetical protein